MFINQLTFTTISMVMVNGNDYYCVKIKLKSQAYVMCAVVWASLYTKSRVYLLNLFTVIKLNILLNDIDFGITNKS